MPATYVDSSALVKLAVHEAESAALRRHLRRRRTLVSSALARTEVLRALLPGGADAVAAGRQVLALCQLVRVNDATLNRAAALLPHELRTLDAIHVATALRLEGELGALVTYDERMADAARGLGIRVVAPA
jgi:predicted nucleic acid-binding protein